METDDPELSGSKLAGFSASYYDFGGKTVIAYRGTDFAARAKTAAA